MKSTEGGNVREITEATREAMRISWLIHKLGFYTTQVKSLLGIPVRMKMTDFFEANHLSQDMFDTIKEKVEKKLAELQTHVH